MNRAVTDSFIDDLVGSPLQVAVGVIKNSSGEILISLRCDHLHQGGLWEFPGGKIEKGETVEQALVRELQEELGITATSFSPLITVNHSYPDRLVRLNVFSVDKFSGTAISRQGQYLCWVTEEKLTDYTFPSANLPIIQAVRLPCYYAILDDQHHFILMNSLQTLLDSGIKLIQARLKKSSAHEVSEFLKDAYPLCQRHNCKLLVNSACKHEDSTNYFEAFYLPDNLDNPADFSGLHLTSHHLRVASHRPKGLEWLSASCHNAYEIALAEKLGVDFIVLGPVLETLTHPEFSPIGWERFSQLVQLINLPVYALGGLTKDCLGLSKKAGGQGIASIRAFL